MGGCESFATPLSLLLDCHDIDEFIGHGDVRGVDSPSDLINEFPEGGGVTVQSPHCLWQVDEAEVIEFIPTIGHQFGGVLVSDATKVGLSSAGAMWPEDGFGFLGEGLLIGSLGMRNGCQQDDVRIKSGMNLVLPTNQLGSSAVD